MWRSGAECLQKSGWDIRSWDDISENNMQEIGFSKSCFLLSEFQWKLLCFSNVDFFVFLMYNDLVCEKRKQKQKTKNYIEYFAEPAIIRSR